MDKQKSGGRFYEQRNFSTSRRSTGCQPAKENMKRLTKLEAVLWSIAFPGFPQLLAGEWVKGILLVGLEIYVNLLSHFNEGIILSFLGKTKKAAEIVDYQWLMFYPCLYMFSMWDAYKMASNEKEKYAYFPFVFSAYTVTLGLIYSPKVYVGSAFLGPIFTPMLFLLPGLVAGILMRISLLHFQKK